MFKRINIIGTFLTVLTMFIIPFSTHAGLDDKSLVLYLSFDEGNGKTAKDGSQYGHDGELIADPKWVDGQYDGKALEFDGTKKQYVKVPIEDKLQLREQFSVAFWVKRGNAQVKAWNYMVAAGRLRWAVIFNNNQKTYVFSDSGGWGKEVFPMKINLKTGYILLSHMTQNLSLLFTTMEKTLGVVENREW